MSWLLPSGRPLLPWRRRTRSLSPTCSRQAGESVTSRDLSTTAGSAEGDRKGKPGFAGFLVLAVHLLGGLSHRGDRLIEADAMVVCDLIAGDGPGGPRLDSAERASFDARDLYVPGDRVARHPQVMLQRRLRSI